MVMDHFKSFTSIQKLLILTKWSDHKRLVTCVPSAITIALPEGFINYQIAISGYTVPLENNLLPILLIVVIATTNKSKVSTLLYNLQLPLNKAYMLCLTEIWRFLFCIT